MAKRRISNKPVVPLSKDDYTMAENELKIGTLLGKGNFSSVYKGTYKGKTVAVKKCEMSDESLVKYLADELAILKRSDHPGVIQFMGAIIPAKKGEYDMTYIITEYIPGGDLRMALSRKSVDLGWKLRINILRLTAEAMLYLHDRNILHRDVKTENILLTLDLQPKLIDLGFARVKAAPGKQMTMCGTDEFMSPEVLFGMEYDERADVFSFGVVAAEVISGKEPGKASKFLDRTPRSGYCVEMSELDKEFKRVKCPQELGVLCKQSCADEAEDRPFTESLTEWLNNIYNSVRDDAKGLKLLNEKKILQEIKEKYDHILNDERNQSVMDTDDFMANGLNVSLRDGGKKGKEDDRRRSVRRGVQDTIKMRNNQAKLKHGYLWKKGPNWRAWKKRYMILSSEGLIYFKTKEAWTRDTGAQGMMLFYDMINPDGHPACEMVSVAMAGKRSSFHVLTKNKKRICAASSEKEAAEWVEAINQGLKDWQARMRGMNA